MKKSIVVLTLSALTLSGCTFGDSTEQQISEVLQNMHNAEEPYRSVQSDLNNVEQQEYQLFEELLTLNQEQQEELTAKVSELQTLAEQRKELLITEKESMDEALEASDFSALEVEEDHEALISEIDNAYDIRYASYEEVYGNYEELIGLQESLYSEMLAEDVSIEMIREWIQQVNDQNDQVQLTVEEMNSATSDFNELSSSVFEQLQNEE